MKFSKLTSTFPILLLLANAMAFAADAPSGKTFVISPETLRKQLLEGDTSILVELNQVHAAKDNVNIARGQLLPSINLGAMLLSGPSFILSSVDFLLPFLFPSNWFNLSETKELLESEKLSYYLLELNEYSSAYALYATVVGDIQLQQILKDQATDLRKIADILQKQDDFFANVSPDDLNHAKAQAATAEASELKMEELVAEEKANLRRALGIALDQELVLSEALVPASNLEGHPVSEVADQAFKTAPEGTQLEFLMSAAKDAKWSKAFGFITGASVSAFAGYGAGGTPKSVAFDKFTGRESIGLGFAYFPSIQLSERNLEDIELRKTELKLETTRVIEAAMGSLQKAAEQYKLQLEAETEMKQVFQAAQKKFELGLESLMDLLITRSQVASASTERVKAFLDMSLLRITLHRSLLTDQFASIKGCNLVKDPEDDDFFLWRWLKDLFAPGSGHQALDRMCKGDITDSHNP